MRCDAIGSPTEKGKEDSTAPDVHFMMALNDNAAQYSVKEVTQCEVHRPTGSKRIGFRVWYRSVVNLTV